MARQTFNDGSSGDVVIRSGPPASGGGGGGSSGGGGGNRVGASGNFGGPSAKTKARRREALRQHREQQAKEKADALARAQEEARYQTRQQLLAGLSQRHGIFRAELDKTSAVRAEHLKQSLEHEISSARRQHADERSERWQLYLITKEKSEIDELIARKTAEFTARNAAALSFDGHDPLTRTMSDYLMRLEQFGEALNNGHQIWENAYSAAHDSRLLSAQIAALTEKSTALTAYHAEQTIAWREREAVWERHRQIAEQRDARIRFKQQADEDARVERVRQANTLSLPANSFAAGGLVLSPGGVIVAQEAAAAIERAIQTGFDTLTDFARIAARTGPVFVTAFIYSPTLGDGELTPEQRNRFLNAVAVPAQTLGLHDRHELQAIADAGGSVEVDARLKLTTGPEGNAVIAASTGGDLDSWVPVVNAVLDPLTGVYNADVPGAPPRHLVFTPDAAPDSTMANQPRLAATEPQVLDIPSGVDLRIQDCIVCVPGLEPIYLSYSVQPMGAGVVTGTGQPASADWWKGATQANGVTIPDQIGNQFRGREFKSFEGFDADLWRALGELQSLIAPFDEVNKKRIERGYRPYAPESTWVGENREFELRYQERPEFWSDPYNLDKVRIKAPNSPGGWLGIVPALVPWPIPPASSWKPLVPPGSEHLGSTTSPITPTTPVVYPGSPAIPVLPENETFPAVDEGEIGANIPGFPGEMELPSPDVLFLDRRDDPGVATGVGQSVSGVWLGDAARGEGAPIPAHIADQLRSREFRNFHGFRRAFWRAIAADPELRVQFTPIDLHLMKYGKAPLAHLPDRNGGRTKFEIHHVVEVAQGGAVYEMDNLVLMTPKRHIELHRKGN
jgi:hypothetical protein